MWQRYSTKIEAPLLSSFTRFGLIIFTGRKRTLDYKLDCDAQSLLLLRYNYNLLIKKLLLNFSRLLHNSVFQSKFKSLAEGVI